MWCINEFSRCKLLELATHMASLLHLIDAAYPDIAFDLRKAQSTANAGAMGGCRVTCGKILCAQMSRLKNTVNRSPDRSLHAGRMFVVGTIGREIVCKRLQGLFDVWQRDTRSEEEGK